jgi:hypothetical protein
MGGHWDEVVIVAPNRASVGRFRFGHGKVLRNNPRAIGHPKGALDFQEKVADVAFTLDFPIPPNLDENEARRRQRLTINALSDMTASSPVHEVIRRTH